MRRRSSDGPSEYTYTYEKSTEDESDRTDDADGGNEERRRDEDGRERGGEMQQLKSRSVRLSFVAQ